MDILSRIVVSSCTWIRISSLTSKSCVSSQESPTHSPQLWMGCAVCMCVCYLSSRLLGMVSTTCDMCCVGMAASTRSMCSSSFNRSAINSARLYAPLDSASLTAAGVISTATAAQTAQHNSNSQYTTNEEAREKAERVALVAQACGRKDCDGMLRNEHEVAKPLYPAETGELVISKRGIQFTHHSKPNYQQHTSSWV